MHRRHVASALLALTAGSALVGLPVAAGAAPAAPHPQYVVQFKAIEVPPATTTGTAFHSTSCAIGPAIDPIVVQCQESGTILFTATGGSGTATVSSPLGSISWTFKLHRSSAVGSSYLMTGKGTESIGTTPVARPVKVTGTIATTPTPIPTFQGTESIYPLPSTIG
jgi:hypothetical protein